MNRFFTIVVVTLVCSLSYAQDKKVMTTKDSTSLVIQNVKDSIITTVEKMSDSVVPFKRYKVDGVAAVVGEYVILNSDIQKMYADLEAQGASKEDITQCNLFGSLLENKLFAHQAEQDSTIVVSDSEINATVDQQVAGFVQQIGSMEKLLAFYNKDNEADLRSELYKVNNENILARRMQQNVVDNVEVTPEEVRAFFDKIPEDERPLLGDEVEIAQIIIEPEVPESEKQKVIERLNQFREDILYNGASFATKAILYSKDGTAKDGGAMSITRKDPLDRTFKDIAFSMQEGEVSEPFESQFGWHIIQVDKILGQRLDIRHIILMPEVTSYTVEKAQKKLDSIRTQIVADSITFQAAARKFSDQEETRQDGGKLVNPRTGDTRFELSKIDPTIYNQVVNLKEGEVSLILTDQTRTGQTFFKIVTVLKRYDEHIANYAQDYSKIKELALREKQLKAIQGWQEEKIQETYVKINGDFKTCNFASNWLKK
ncbi:peptidylprolyl isomerase [Gangjinia marincola]|uniref:Peptidylprolyl isomerase n=1 Tax=Gangjinia marincola TaxID=578463 RepID=A0ABP3XRU7_9FLAO